MATFLPAIRARMGDVGYFTTTLTLGEVARLVEYAEEVDGWTSETPSELKLQRKLNVQRVEREMVPYLVASDDHFYSALTVEIRPIPGTRHDPEQCYVVKERFPGGVEFGMLTLDGTERLYALDGQHRLKSIELAIRQRPELAGEHIALILVPYISLMRSQTLFSDLNRYAKVPSKSISLLFTHRERLARIAKALAHTVPLLQERVNMESTALAASSRHFITLSTLYEMTKTLVGDEARNAPDEASTVEELALLWARLTQSLTEWRRVADGEEHPAYLRQRYLNMHGLAQQSIALAVARVRRERTDWQDALADLSSIDWQLTNPVWQGVALQAGRVNNTSTSIRLLADFLAARMGVAPPQANPTASAG